MSRHLRYLLALVAVFALVAAGCGGDDDDDTSSTDDTSSDDTSDDTAADLSDEEVVEEFCAIDADIEEVDADLEAAFEDEDLDALRDALDENIEIAGRASDLPLDVIEDGLEDELDEYLDETQQLADDLADVDDFDEAVELVTAYGEEQSNALAGAAGDVCETEETTPETEDTTPVTEASDGTAAQIVDSVLGQTGFGDGPEAECIVAGLEETFDGDELGAFLAADTFSEADATALSEVFESCLPYQDVVASGIEGQLGDEVVEQCVVASYDGYDWVPIFTDPAGEQALIEETVQLCSEAATGDAGAPTPNPPGTVVDLFEANIGDCFLAADQTPASYTVVDCAQPHDKEVFALYDLPDGAFPGEEAIAEAAIAGCVAEFEAYVGIAYEESALFADQPIAPSAGSWDAGDREVICLLYSPDGQIEGSGYQAAV